MELQESSTQMGVRKVARMVSHRLNPSSATW